MIKQSTLKKSINIKGFGLHSGKPVKLTLNPAPVNSGIIYRRIDISPPVEFISNVNLIKNTNLCTSLENKNGVNISTVEHLSAAICGLGIDNIIIEITSSEIPIMDGSSWPFVDIIINSSGIKTLEHDKKFIYIKKIVRVEKEDKWIEVTPSNKFTLDFSIDFDHPVISSTSQNFFFTFSVNSFINQISKARTFGFLRDIKYLQSNKLALGGNCNCAIVIGNKRILNKEGLRFSNEFIRHKILDAIGDFFVSGYNIVGAFKAFKPGHNMHYMLLKKIFRNKNTWEFSTMKNNHSYVNNF
ncbi:lpxC [Wigglesworthia glossinidia endosymbiont of Glossina brevipalpis]|uniref:UDP-3-O-acyl-N-acetylglucosamine deacetylase n=1 Tax=Wigglesworthia glossinidia brevipalpis TaxID=36870 RepID=LPXC_WIGBR|nr:RecName: Full=UDP-3-O-acyl-N-acetylglucosamine deacetylase; Short=UDP-3-O-acyl-GlcNAc deacetylase; AltName: Full=UDP-3-O-[R-3-hydroxymyristoyl]-N-acetylglucosamine deacetylase [Wigglesworthia glossinidia endosymbiont of Glossina brevipalpis]BAC24347.1 lpxC [Wigglesworthia glossinidia endosymbiont of Glossina brevipalpis]